MVSTCTQTRPMRLRTPSRKMMSLPFEAVLATDSDDYCKVSVKFLQSRFGSLQLAPSVGGRL